MLLSEYQAHLAGVIDRYARTDLIVSSALSVDARTPKIGVIRAQIVFFDGSQLYLTEYVDARYRLEKLSYSHHCQDEGGNLLFRYHNAAHKPPLSFPSHKHLPGGAIIEASVPDLENILDEVMEQMLP